MDYVFWCCNWKVSPNPRSLRHCSVLSSRSFILLYYAFRPMVHFEWVFVKSVRSLRSLCWLVDVRQFQHRCWTDCLLNIELSLLLFQSLADYNCLDLFLGSLFCFIGLFVYSFTKTVLSWLWSLFSKAWSRVVSVLQIHFFPSIFCWLFWVSVSPYKL